MPSAARSSARSSATARRSSRTGRRAPGGRPRDRLHAGRGRAPGRQRAVTLGRGRDAQEAPAAGPRSTSWPAINLVGMLGEVPGTRRRSSRRRSRSGTAEPFWPFLATGAIIERSGLRARAADGGSRPPRRSARRLPGRLGHVLLTAAFAALPYLLHRRRPARAIRSTRTSRGCPASTTTGASVVTDFDELVQVALDVAPVHAVARRDGDHRPRHRGPAAPASRRPPADGVRAARPRGRAAPRAHPADRAAPLGPLRRAHRCPGTRARALGWLGRRRADDAVRSPSPTRSRRCRPAVSRRSPTRSQAFSAAAQWIIALFMLIAGANFVLLYSGLVRRRPRRFVRDEEFRLYLAIVLVASSLLTVQIWGYGIAEGEEAIRAGSSRPSRSSRRPGIASDGLRALAGASRC